MRILFLLFVSALCSFSAEKRHFNIHVNESLPMFTQDGDNISGFEYDMLNTLSAKLHFTYTLKVEPNAQAVIESVQTTNDIGLGSISITSDRLKSVDFSQPYFNGGLVVVMLASWKDTAKLVIHELTGILLTAVIFVFIMGNIIWYSQKGYNKINDDYYPGIFDAMYFVIVTASTVGYGDITCTNASGRFMTIVLIMSGITYFGAVTGKMASVFTIETSLVNIESVSELNGKVLSAKENTTGSRFADSLSNLTFNTKTFDESIKLLLNGHVKAVIHDKPESLFYASTDSRLKVSHQTFKPERYGLALSKDSPDTDRFSEAILTMEETGELEKLKKKWFK